MNSLKQEHQTRQFDDHYKHNGGPLGFPFKGNMILQNSRMTEISIFFEYDHPKSGVKTQIKWFLREMKSPKMATG